MLLHAKIFSNCRICVSYRATTGHVLHYGRNEQANIAVNSILFYLIPYVYILYKIAVETPLLNTYLLLSSTARVGPWPPL
jgi:hypothetical protein